MNDTERLDKLRDSIQRREYAVLPSERQVYNVHKHIGPQHMRGEIIAHLADIVSRVGSAMESNAILQDADPDASLCDEVADDLADIVIIAFRIAGERGYNLADRIRLTHENSIWNAIERGLFNSPKEEGKP